MAIFGALLTSACDVGTAGFQPTDTPPPKVLSVKATTSLNSDAQPVREQLAVDGSSTVLSTTSLVIRFDRFLLPASAIRQSVCVRSNLDPVARSEDCENGLFLEPTYDPTHREITYRQSSSNPGLSAGTTYQLTVFAPPDVSSNSGIRAFDGAPLDQPYVIQFKTAAADPMGAVLEGPPAGDLFCSAEDCLKQCNTSSTVATCQAACPTSCAAECMCDPMDATCTDNCPAGDTTCKQACRTCRNCGSDCLAQCTSNCPNSIAVSLSSCAFSGCHAPTLDGTTGSLLVGAAMGMELTPEGLYATAINRVARQTQQGERASLPDKNPLRFGRAMPIIDAAAADAAGGNPGNSYLLYKLAVGRSAIGEAAVDPAEIDRLRASVVAGMPMPPSSNLRDIDLKAIAEWIAQGAPVPACP